MARFFASATPKGQSKPRKYQIESVRAEVALERFKWLIPGGTIHEFRPWDEDKDGPKATIDTKLSTSSRPQVPAIASDDPNHRVSGPSPIVRSETNLLNISKVPDGSVKVEDGALQNLPTDDGEAVGHFGGGERGGDASESDAPPAPTVNAQQRHAPLQN